ncbi:MAG: 50S ribosomal protein L11 methyltransferase [Terrimonas sp.]|nr:50S ribosomal protein L11 methyltransferase [Terrimonas sp.]
MDNYIKIHFNKIASDQAELLLALLSNAGYEGFEEGDEYFSAFIPETAFDEATLQSITGSLHLQFEKSIIASKNWNQEWESSFDPVTVDDFCSIRAAFHSPVNNMQHEIIITPKQSFGTGHHATTFLMIRQLKTMELKGKKVFDYGTGTGVLAILAEKMGAAEVLAIDNDDWSIENAGENILMNHCTRVKLEKQSVIPSNSQFDIILANINKNVITANFQSLADGLVSGGKLVLSGLLKTDEPDILSLSENADLQLQHREERGEWISLTFKALKINVY